jgi:E3 ubiquitin-protein ligase DOA10
MKQMLEKSYYDQNYSFLPGVVNMVSKHKNGTVNLWHLQFQEHSKYQSLIYISHLSRIFGHRWRVNSIFSHPILPFLLSNSIDDDQNINSNHTKETLPADALSSSSIASTIQSSSSQSSTVNSSYNIPYSTSSNFPIIEDSNQFDPFKNANSKTKRDDLIDQESSDIISSAMTTTGVDTDNLIQKGLIIWGVEPVGPLTKSGGIYELARIDTVKENAFENIAWFPCFLPNSTLGKNICLKIVFADFFNKFLLIII